MKKITSKYWWEASLIRAVRTFCQTFASMIGIGAAFEDVDWIRIISVSITATILSLATSIATDLPELNYIEDSKSEVKEDSTEDPKEEESKDVISEEESEP